MAHTHRCPKCNNQYTCRNKDKDMILIIYGKQDKNGRFDELRMECKKVPSLTCDACEDKEL